MTFAVRTLQGSAQRLVELVGGTFNNLFGTAPVYAGYKVDSDGYEYHSTSDGSLVWSQDAQWLKIGAASDYYVRATLTGDALAAGSSATGSWLQLNADRAWYLEDTIGSLKDTDLVIEISNSATGSPVLATANVNLTAESTL